MDRAVDPSSEQIYYYNTTQNILGTANCGRGGGRRTRPIPLKLPFREAETQVPSKMWTTENPTLGGFCSSSGLVKVADPSPASRYITTATIAKRLSWELPTTDGALHEGQKMVFSCCHSRTKPRRQAKMSRNKIRSVKVLYQEHQGCLAFRLDERDDQIPEWCVVPYSKTMAASQI
jgi:hypothetical protein